MNLKLSKNLIILFLVFVVFGLAKVSLAASYYISTSGNDSNPGTQTQPWRTIQKAANTISAGDTVNIQSGSYNESVTMSRSGSAGLPITFLGAGQTSKIKISGSYIIVDGLTISGNTSGNSLLIAGNNNTVKNTIIQNQSNYDTVIVSENSAYNNLITGNTIQNCNNVDVFRTWGHDNTISFNEIKNISCTDVTNIHCDFIQIFGCPGDIGYNINVTGNYVHDSDIQSIMLAQMGGWDGTKLCQLPNIGNFHHWTFSNNIFSNLTGSGFVKVPNSYFFNNIFYRSGTNNGFALSVSKDSEGDGMTGSRIYNNIFLSPGDVPGASASGNNYSAESGNPGFVSLVTPDFHLTSTATALIDKGANLNTFFTIDKDSIVRPQGMGWDIGAYEYGSTTNTAPAAPTGVKVI